MAGVGRLQAAGARVNVDSRVRLSGSVTTPQCGIGLSAEAVAGKGFFTVEPRCGWDWRTSMIDKPPTRTYRAVGEPPPRAPGWRDRRGTLYARRTFSG